MSNGKFNNTYIYTKFNRNKFIKHLSKDFEMQKTFYYQY